MKLSLLLNSVLFAATALAAPRGLAARMARRAARSSHATHPLIPSSKEATTQMSPAGVVNSVEYSSNWAGAVLTSPPAGSTFNKVSGQFTAPGASAPSGGSSKKNTEYAASAWVGIDGDTYQNAILQAGIDVYYESGKISYDAWYEWYPDYAYDFSGITIAEGDTISVTIDATSDSKGTVTVSNLSNGESVSETLDAPSSSSTLGGQNAEWIVEDFEEGDSLVPFADFGTVVFTDAVADTTSGASVGITDAQVLDIEQNSKVLTSVTINSNSEVTISYV